MRLRFGWIRSDDSPPQPESLETNEKGESEFVRQRKRNWARLIQKTWLEDPEICPSCGEKMRVITAISSPAQDQVIEKILKSVGLWDPPWKRERKIRGPPRQLDMFSAEEEMFSEERPAGEEDFDQSLPDEVGEEDIDQSPRDDSWDF